MCCVFLLGYKNCFYLTAQQCLHWQIYIFSVERKYFKFCKLSYFKKEVWNVNHRYTSNMKSLSQYFVWNPGCQWQEVKGCRSPHSYCCPFSACKSACISLILGCFYHCQDHLYPTRWDLAWSSRWREVVSDPGFLPVLRTAPIVKWSCFHQAAYLL